MLSTILDISSFFIGMLINLLLIALICYYFKRKYETLELAQNEQAKILYNLIQSQTPRKQFDIADIMKTNFISNDVEKTQCVIEEESDSDSDSDSDSSDSDEDVNNVKVLNLKETEVIDYEEEDPPFTVTKVADTKVADTKVADTKVADTKVADTKVADTKVADTKVVKTKLVDSELVDSELVESAELNDAELTSAEVFTTEVDYSKMTIKELKDVLSKKGISSNPRMKKNDLIQLIEVGVSDVLNLTDELSEVNI